MTSTLVPPPADRTDTAQLIGDEEPDVEVILLRPSTALRISVVIPALNEERNIGWVLERLPADLHEVILVDGQSIDGTVATAQAIRPDVRILVQAARGKGAALLTGLSAVTGDIVVMLDADGSMDPAEIPGLVGALLAGADVVKGSRSAAGGGSTDLTVLRQMGNCALTFLANLLYRQNWRELCYGYAAFWTDVLATLNVHDIATTTPTVKAIPIHSGAPAGAIAYGHGFEIEAVLFCRAARSGLRVAEAFSFEHQRCYGESNLATWRDGYRVLRAILKERSFRPTDADVLRHLRRYPVIPQLHSFDGHLASQITPITVPDYRPLPLSCKCGTVPASLTRMASEEIEHGSVPGVAAPVVVAPRPSAGVPRRGPFGEGPICLGDAFP